MTNTQKERGKYFERKIVDSIRKTFELKKFECQRASSSGTGEFEFGDIFFNDPEKFPYIFECKFGYNWEFSTFFPSVSKQILNFLKEAFEAGEKYKIKIKQDPKLICVVLAKPHYKPLGIVTEPILQIENPIIIPDNYFVFKKQSYPIYIYNFEHVLDILKYEKR
jgi:Holliday junction resolvase